MLPADQKWSPEYQAWRIERLDDLLQELGRKDAIAQLQVEEIGRPWKTWAPLPALN